MNFNPFRQISKLGRILNEIDEASNQNQTAAEEGHHEGELLQQASLDLHWASIYVAKALETLRKCTRKPQ